MNSSLICCSRCSFDQFRVCKHNSCPGILHLVSHLRDCVCRIAATEKSAAANYAQIGDWDKDVIAKTADQSRFSIAAFLTYGVYIITTSPGRTPSLSRPSMNLLTYRSKALGLRQSSGFEESSHIGLSETAFSSGNK